ncbi:MAG: hypothetical protein JXX28_00515 [Deltaproteobacteria bacterium]|nr:hypothetical protein [Deltaproteobacteria bacterium]
MILVTGTKRSGTSMWMQILIAGGLPHIGDAFPAVWGSSIREANPKGFYESRLRQGVFYATNPDPETGQFFAPAAVTTHAVKVFIPGLVRTDLAYMQRVVASMRSWRAYSQSLSQLYSREDAWLLENPTDGRTGAEAVADAVRKRCGMPLPVEWFMENFDLIRDFAVRRYALNLCTYERLMDSPEAEVRKVFAWLGVGDPDQALTAIEPSLNRTAPEAWIDDGGLPRATLQLFEDLHAAIHERSTVPRSLLPELNSTWETLRREYGKLSRERGREDALS